MLVPVLLLSLLVALPVAPEGSSPAQVANAVSPIPLQILYDLVGEGSDDLSVTGDDDRSSTTYYTASSGSGSSSDLTELSVHYSSEDYSADSPTELSEGDLAGSEKRQDSSKIRVVIPGLSSK